MYPIVFFVISKKIKSTIVKSIPAGIGFLIPVGTMLFYFCYHNALSDMYWWTIKWAAIYNATALNPVIAFLARIGRMFQSFGYTWDWLPVFVIVGIYLVQMKKSKERVSVESLSIFVFFILSFFCRMILRKPAIRYNGYLLTSLILIIPFVKMYRIRLFVAATTVFMAVLIVVTSIVNHRKFMEEGPQFTEVDRFVITHSTPKDTIWAWMSDSYVYYKTKRKMGTLVFDPHQNLDYGLAWEKSNYRGIDFLWDKFMSDLEVCRPRLIIDSSGGFASVDDYTYKGPLLEYMQRFLNYMNANYRVAIVIDGTKIWERIN
jgi:hypothetical protein